MWPDAGVGSFVRLLFEGSLCDQQIRTSFDYHLDNISGTPEAINIVMTGFFADSQWSALRGAFLECCPENYTLDNIRWQYYKNPAVYAAQRVPSGATGSQGEAYTANVQATIVRRPVTATRRGVGAIRVPMPVSTATVIDGVLVAGYKDTLQELANLMDDTIIHVGGGATTYHWNPTVLTKTDTWWSQNPVFSCFVEPTSRVLRRRTARLGI